MICLTKIFLKISCHVNAILDDVQYSIILVWRLDSWNSYVLCRVTDTGNEHKDSFCTTSSVWVLKKSRLYSDSLSECRNHFDSHTCYTEERKLCNFIHSYEYTWLFFKDPIKILHLHPKYIIKKTHEYARLD